MRLYFWKKEEDELILRLYNTYNGNWKKISEFVPNRSTAALKNRFYGVIKKKAGKSMDKREHDAVETVESGTTVESIIDENHQENMLLTKPLENLTPEEKRKKITELYNSMLALQSQLQRTKEKIEKIQIK